MNLNELTNQPVIQNCGHPSTKLYGAILPYGAFVCDCHVHIAEKKGWPLLEDKPPAAPCEMASVRQ